MCLRRLFHVLPPLPTIPGVSAVGRVEEVAEDVFDVGPGQLVFVDPQVLQASLHKEAWTVSLSRCHHCFEKTHFVLANYASIDTSCKHGSGPLNFLLLPFNA